MTGAPHRQFAFSAFQFPACKACNEWYGAKLEAPAKSVMQEMVRHQPITVVELEIILDWLDKVRIGLWLGMRLLGGNVANIEPKFHIDQRLGSKDRVLHVQRLPDPETRLTIYGVDTPIFQIHPAVFVLRVNGMILTSASADFIVSYFFGLPSSNSDRKQLPDGRTDFAIGSTNAFSYPWGPIPVACNGPGMWVGQPIAPLRWIEDPRFVKMYDTPWARSLGWNSSNGRCRIHTSPHGEPQPYPNGKSLAWLPKEPNPYTPIAEPLMSAQEHALVAYGGSPADDPSVTALVNSQKALLRMVRTDPVKYSMAVELGDT